MKTIAAIVIISVFFGVSRFFAPGHDVSLWGTWEVFAHFWCCFLVGMGGWYKAAPGDFAPAWTQVTRLTCWVSLAIISGIELAMFIAFKANQ